MANVNVLKAIAVTAELCGRTLSEPAARMFVEDLSAYPEDQVLKALERCRREVRGLLTVADVINRMSDGRPAADEAWAIALRGRDEAETVVWTEEIQAALAAAQPVIDLGDDVGARMAFKDAYTRLVSEARDARKPAQWSASLGWDVSRRHKVLDDGVRAGLLSAPAVAGLLPPPQVDEATLPATARRKLAEIRSLIDGVLEQQDKAREEAAQFVRREREQTAAQKAELAARVAIYQAQSGGK